MKVHGPSVAIGFASALVVAVVTRRLRPVAVEIAALAMDVANVARAAIEVQREKVEDFWCDVQHRSTQKAQERRKERMRRSETAKPAAASEP